MIPAFQQGILREHTMKLSCLDLVGPTLLVLVICSPAQGQDKPAPYEPPTDIAYRQATVVSEGTRMTAELFALKRSEGKALPTIIMCHGWGGIAAMLRPDAVT